MVLKGFGVCLGKGMLELILVDRVMIVNMFLEYGVIMGFFLVDCVFLDYLKMIGWDEKKVR